MSTSGRTDDADAPPTSDVAAALRDAEFVRVLARADGDCLAVAGLLAQTCIERGVPYQVRVGRFGETVPAAEDDETTVTGGLDPAADVHLPSDPTSASVTAFDAAADLDATADPVLALAGVSAAGHPPGASESVHVLEVARESGVEQRPGVGIPTADLVDGLAHSTLVHTSDSGDREAVQATLAELGLPAELDDEAHRAVASDLALAVSGDESATERAAETVERALRPHATPDAAFATVEGYADVLNAVAREQPGVGVALALGHDVRDDALDAWRTHGERAHEVLRDATTGRYDGLFALRTDDAPVETVARLLWDYRSPEPVALVVSETEAAATAVEDSSLGESMTEATNHVGGTGGGTPTRAYASFDPETDTKAFLTAFREAHS
jgi:hypothetical protein